MFTAEWAVKYLQHHDVLRRLEMKAKERAHATAAVSADEVDPGQEESRQEEEFMDPCETQEQVSELLREEADKTTAENGDDDRKKLMRDDARQRGVNDQIDYEDKITFRADHRGRSGYLEVSSQGLRFIVKTRRYSLSMKNPKKTHRIREELWSYSFADLVQMTKQSSPVSSKFSGIDPGLKRLELEVLTPTSPTSPAAPTTTDGEGEGDNVIRASRSPSYPGDGESPKKRDPYIYAGKRGMSTRIETLDFDRGERDEVFNLVVGWSKARWQVLTTRSEAKAETERKKKGQKEREEEQ
jgi:hypothetical protein